MNIEDLFGRPLVLDPEEFSGGGDFAPLEGGNYRLQIESVENRTFDGGEKITYTGTIIEGKGQNRKVWLDFTVKHANPVVIEIAMKEIIKYFMACGVYDANSNNHDMYAPVGKTPVVRVVYNEKTRYPNYRFLSADGQMLVIDGKYTQPPAHVLAAAQAKQGGQPAAQPAAQPQQAAGAMPWQQQQQPA